MSLRESVRRAETLRRVSELEQQLARASLAASMERARAAHARVLAADRLVREQQDLAAGTAGQLVERQARVLAAAQARSDTVRAAAQAETDLAAARRGLLEANMRLKGRERLKDRRVAALREHITRMDQRVLDESSRVRQGEAW